MKDNPFSLRVYLSQSPLPWLTMTLLVYATTDAVSLPTRRHSLANPVLTGIMSAIVVTPLMNSTGVTDFRARGFAAGLAAHGIGTAPRVPGRRDRWRLLPASP